MAVTLDSVFKQYVAPDGSAVPVIHIPKFALLPGEHVALIGTSGSGKTTLLHLIAGILVPDRGRIVFSGTRDDARGSGSAVVPYSTPPGLGREVDISQLSEARRDVFRGQNIGYIFQTHHLLGGFTALENVQLGMSFTGRRVDVGWATHLLTAVGLADRMHYKPGKLSVGQQQRVAVARALANRPLLVLADEPTGALDPANAQQVLDLIRTLCTEVGASLLLVTHDMTIANQLPRQVMLGELNQPQVK